ncbi:hypothetical protein QQX98_010511 [Neonectria punicea]|uniref:Enoyl-CoA hydratase n=1 Tax=Neonectria punicea TaxID=979145 RepID=A0ABR1GPA4_9HYPO
MASPLSTSPPDIPRTVLISFCTPHVLLVTLNRPEQLNALPRQVHLDLAQLWDWYDTEPYLRCAVITGNGRAFCAGADLKEWHEKNNGGVATDEVNGKSWVEKGFGGFSNRRGKKPIISAVNGHYFGGGFEMVLNSDCVIANETAKFGLPEVTLGIVAIAGALPRLIRIIGRQRASEMVLLGGTYTAQQLCDLGIVNKVIPETEVLDEALRWAAKIADKSPDSIIVSRAGLLGGWGGEDPETNTWRVRQGIYKDLESGDNMKEGVLSFVEKRRAVWKASKM